MKFLKISKKHVGLYFGIIISLNLSMMSMVLAVGEIDEETLPSQWAIEKVDLARSEGLIPETLDFLYTNSITRAEFSELAAKILENLEIEVSIEDSNPFSDVEGSIYKESLVLMYNAEIIEGYGNGKFGPDDLVTREQIAVIISKLIEVINPEENLDIEKTYSFVDQDKISNWANKYVIFCYDKEIMKGVAELRIAPKSYTTREQAMVLLYNTKTKYSEPSNQNEIKVVKFEGKENLVKMADIYGADEIKVIEEEVNKIINDPSIESAYVEDVNLFTNFSIDENLITVKMSTDKNTAQIEADYKAGNPTYKTMALTTMFPSHKVSVEFARKIFGNTKNSKEVLVLFDEAIKEAINKSTTISKKVDVGIDGKFNVTLVDHIDGIVYVIEYVEVLEIKK